MTNKATVSQPKVVAAKPSEPVIQAMKAILFSGRIVDTFMIYDLYNAAHRVERSQPKSTPQEKIPQESIGDDALSEFIEEYEWRTDAFCHKPTEAERLMLLDFAVNLDDSRAPAAQASATIQAAPRPTDDELWDATLRDRDAYHEWADKLADGIATHFGADIGEHSNQNLPWAEALEVIESAATIQEPVMVAEPSCTLPPPYGQMVFGELHVVPGYGAEQMRAMFEAGRAVPMVADPAGVARFDFEEWFDEHSMGVQLRLSKEFDEFKSAVHAHYSQAATVKAIPSEALEAAVKACEQVQARVIESNGGEAHYDDWSTMDEGIYAGAGYCIGKINALQIAAPLADKTGGGD